MTKISVLMPVYNTKEEFLREAIDSILKQTYDEFEFLIIDDGSTNNVAEVINSYNDTRIRYFYKKNTGIADTLNYGIKQAQGEYIARMDSDDISLPERFAKQVDFLNKNPEISLVGTQYESFPKKFIPQLPLTMGILDLLSFTPIAHPSIMYRKVDFTQNNLFYNPEFVPAEDLELWSRAITKLKFANLPNVLLKYRQNPQGLSLSQSQKQAQKTQFIKEKILEKLTTNTALRKKIMQDTSPKTSKKYISLFGFLPLFKIKNKDNKKTWYLFNIIPFLKIRN